MPCLWVLSRLKTVNREQKLNYSSSELQDLIGSYKLCIPLCSNLNKKNCENIWKWCLIILVCNCNSSAYHILKHISKVQVPSTQKFSGWNKLQSHHYGFGSFLRDGVYSCNLSSFVRLQENSSFFYCFCFVIVDQSLVSWKYNGFLEA